MTEIKLDFDGAMPIDLMERLRFVAWWQNLGKPGPVLITKTRRGYHVYTTFKPTLSPVAVVAVQAICGSDYRRESFNLMRARRLAHAPTFWQSRSNVLYARKL